MSTSVKRSEKQLSCNTNFYPFFQHNSSNFMIKPCKKPWRYSYQNFQKDYLRRGLGQVTMKKRFPETISHKAFQTMVSCKIAH